VESPAIKPGLKEPENVGFGKEQEDEEIEEEYEEEYEEEEEEEETETYNYELERAKRRESKLFEFYCVLEMKTGQRGSTNDSKNKRSSNTRSAK